MTKRNKIIYWASTLWLALGMAATGGGQLVGMKQGQGGKEMLTHLGYPAYLLILLGTWKILGVVAVLLPGFLRLKEWAYAGFVFLTTGAMFSHLASKDPLTSVFPALLLLILTITSWYFRPAERRVGTDS
ncbi:MAG: DoxX family protein [Thermoanaerobaculia bacterium]